MGNLVLLNCRAFQYCYHDVNNVQIQAAAPKKWKGPDGKATEMDTPYTIRAQQLKDIYNSINMKYLTQDERLDVLLTLKHTVKVLLRFKIFVGFLY